MRNSHLRFIKSFLLALVLLSIFFADAALANGENSDRAQSPVQVIFQIVATAAILKALDRFDLP